MKVKVITTTSDLSRCAQLKRSLDYFGYDYHFIQHEWKGFLDKIHETYKYLKSLEGYTHFLYTDAWDTFALGTPDEMLSKMPKDDILLISAERACYPHPGKEPLYPTHESPWHFVNGGGWAGSIKKFCEMYEAEPPTTELNDQVYLTDQFLNHYKEGWIKLDYDCEIFQTIAFCPESDFEFKIQKHKIPELQEEGLKLVRRDYPYGDNKVTNTRPIFWHGNGHCPMPHIYKLLPTMQTLKEVTETWADRPEVHKLINESFTDNVNADPKLKEYRDWIESKIFGFGERSFLWMWKLIVDELTKKHKLSFDVPQTINDNGNFSFLEIGVFRGQILGLIRMLAPKASIIGITPLTSEGGHWESDYAADIKLLHDTFKLKQPEIIKGLSTDPDIIALAGLQSYDVVYVDGGHTKEVAHSDVYIYSSFVKVGGFLVIDDCAHKYNLPEGYFKGIEPVSKAVDELLPNEYYKELFSVVHNRVFQRIK